MGTSPIQDRRVDRTCGTPRIELVRLDGGELTGASANDLRVHVDGCAGCQAVMTELAEARRSLFELAEPVAASARILAAAELRSSRPRYAWAFGLACAAAIALGIVAVPRPEPYSATKGGRSGLNGPPRSVSERASLELFTKTSAGISAADDGVELVEGDAIQLRYHSGPHRYLLVISIDGARKVTPWYPAAAEGMSLPITRGQGTLDGSIVLDDALGTEQVIGFFSDEPLRVSDLVSAVEHRIEHRLVEGSSTAGLPGIAAEVVTRSFKKVPR
ncbi:MAG: hypothetical protein HY791_25330 [Deltaproteobacteria bacterium]|nr:hypothetical protein [Deltaproteobacteria bacterium]